MVKVDKIVMPRDRNRRYLRRTSDKMRLPDWKRLATRRFYVLRAGSAILKKFDRHRSIHRRKFAPRYLRTVHPKTTCQLVFQGARLWSCLKIGKMYFKRAFCLLAIVVVDQPRGSSEVVDSFEARQDIFTSRYTIISLNHNGVCIIL